MKYLDELFVLFVRELGWPAFTRSYLDASSTEADPGRSPGDSHRDGRDRETRRDSVTSTAASASVRVNLYEEMVGLTARVIARTLLDREITPTETRRFIHATQTVADEFEVSPVTLLRQLLPTPPSAEYRRAIEEMHEWADGVIEEHRRAENPPDNLITRLLEAEQQATAGTAGSPSGHSTSEPWAPNLIRDEILTFLFAGHETTALALCYALGFVANNPESPSGSERRPELCLTETANRGCTSRSSSTSSA
ncbi:MAG: cytochrome P450 [Haloarculaceae archaeon]